MSTQSLPFGIVKSILSGDSLVLRGKPAGGPPPEKVYSLSQVSAPRLNTKELEKEEPFAFDAREYLRRLVIGKTLTYKTDYVTTSGREFGQVFLSEAVNGESNVTKIMVKEGWLRVKSLDGKHDANELQLELLDLEREAQSLHKGMWSDQNASKGHRTASLSIEGDLKVYLDKYKGKAIEGILEQARDASTFRALLLHKSETGENVHQYITLSLSGIKSPIYRKGIPNVPDLVEPFAEEGRFFVESRLVQKDVKIVLEGLPPNSSSTNYPTFIGSVQFPAGNIAEVLLAEGFAKVNDWTLPLVTVAGDKYRVAEKKAKDRRARLWKDYVPAASSLSSLESTFEGIVTRILGADMLLVEKSKTKEEVKIQLSSVRGPKRTKNETGFETGLFPDAVEFLRSRLVGNTVSVTIDYIKPAEGDYEARMCATVLNGTQNIAEALVSKGLAQVIRHRKDDENRSSKYDALLMAEDRAQAGTKGLWSGKEPTVHRISDASDSLAKAKQFLPFLQKTGELSGVVEFCSSASRFRILIPSQSCRLTLVLGGIRVPRAGGQANTKSEPFGPESLAFVNRQVLQRDVTLIAENLDKTGGFVGSLFLTVAGNKKNLAVWLLEQGFGFVHGFSASQSPFAAQLYDAEKNAKAALLGVWKDYDAAAYEAQVEASRASSMESLLPEEKDIVVSEIGGADGSLYVQIMGDDVQRLEKMMSAFSTAYKEPYKGAFTPKAGDYCAARFTMDNQWYRAQVQTVSKGGVFKVLYIDYGNSETVSQDRIRPLDLQFSIKTLKPQALHVQLAHMLFPSPEDDYFLESLDLLKSFTEGKILKAKFLNQTVQPAQVILYTPDTVNVNDALLRAGLAYLDKRVLRSQSARSAPVSQELQELLDSQAEAQRNHEKLWRYGDFTADEDD